MRCPICGSREIRVEAYDFGICQQAGYCDFGERFRCVTCGAPGDVVIEDEEYE